MRGYIRDFIRRGLCACGFGPMVLAVLYLILKQQGLVEILTVNEVCLGIVSLSALAFLAGGMNVIYQVERIPLMAAIFIHGFVLYVSYLATYLINNWLEWGIAPILAFSGIFVLGYLIIWAVIYMILKKKTARISEILKNHQQCADDP